MRLENCLCTSVQSVTLHRQVDQQLSPPIGVGDPTPINMRACLGERMQLRCRKFIACRYHRLDNGLTWERLFHCSIKAR
jgi:hypothetical protein